MSNLYKEALALHTSIQVQVGRIIHATGKLQEGHTPTVREILSALEELTNQGLQLGRFLEANERADARLDADPPEVPQAGAQG